ncbi:hypothetical protein [Paenibacillus sp. FSL A5-0031]|uniref:hypothetical protein n=1 Tax=Paenibacillus sp. FSL A5-0031 TaxID=1920420 RepID=UPI0015C3081A|nr:hypothetical protein [Paenibacillus sp. FSL A5-0031]
MPTEKGGIITRRLISFFTPLIWTHFVIATVTVQLSDVLIDQPTLLTIHQPIGNILGR